MIVGRGLLASAFAPLYESNDDVVVFASGVSNSLETEASNFQREEAMLTELLLGHGAARLVYFGSCGVTDADADLTPYMRHKRSMEALVLSEPRNLVLRLPQVVSRTRNPNTLTNFLRDRIISGEQFTVWSNAERNLIDIDDIVTLGSELISHSTMQSVAICIAALRSTPMPGIVKIFEDVLGKAANCTYVQKGAPMRIDTRAVDDLSSSLGLDLGEGYAERIIRKYYAEYRAHDARSDHSIAKNTA